MIGKQVISLIKIISYVYFTYIHNKSLHVITYFTYTQHFVLFLFYNIGLILIEQDLSWLHDIGNTIKYLMDKIIDNEYTLLLFIPFYYKYTT